MTASHELWPHQNFPMQEQISSIQFCSNFRCLLCSIGADVFLAFSPSIHAEKRVHVRLLQLYSVRWHTISYGRAYVHSVGPLFLPTIREVCLQY